MFSKQLRGQFTDLQLSRLSPISRNEVTRIRWRNALLAGLVCALSAAASADDLNLAPDGTWVRGEPQLAPDGSWVGGEPELAPDGKWVGGGDAQLAPDGSWVGGEPELAPDGSWVGGGDPQLAPDGSWR